MTKNKTAFDFKEFDAEGLDTLKVISEAVNFNTWTYNTIRPFCNGKILEVGSGIGNISELFINASADLTISDIRKNYREFLANRFPELASESKIIPIDLVLPDFDMEYKNILGSFDTVFSLNVIEHIENDSQAIANCKKLLRPGGTLITLMPGLPWLYNNFDKELFHFRRYNKSSMQQLFVENEMEIVNTFYFNSGGIPGWFVSGKLMQNKIIPANQMKFFDKLVPLFKIIDKLFLNKIGLSLICVGKRE